MAAPQPLAVAVQEDLTPKFISVMTVDMDSLQVLLVAGWCENESSANEAARMKAARKRSEGEQLHQYMDSTKTRSGGAGRKMITVAFRVARGACVEFTNGSSGINTARSSSLGIRAAGRKGRGI